MGGGPIQDVHMWVARWISAAGLLAFWGATCEAARGLELPEILALEQAVALNWQEPEWDLGVSAGDVLTMRLVGLSVGVAQNRPP